VLIVIHCDLRLALKIAAQAWPWHCHHPLEYIDLSRKQCTNQLHAMVGSLQPFYKNVKMVYLLVLVFYRVLSSIVHPHFYHWILLLQCTVNSAHSIFWVVFFIPLYPDVQETQPIGLYFTWKKCALCSIKYGIFWIWCLVSNFGSAHSTTYIT